MFNHTSSQELVTSLLSTCRERDYAGYSKFDALNSPILNTLSCNRSWLRFIFTQIVKECPFHIRPFLRVQQSRNPKGIALFVRAYLHLYQLTGNSCYVEYATDLLDWLIANRSKGNKNYCWGYNFIWQSQLFHLEAFEPNAVVTVFVAEAFLHAFRVTGDKRFLEVARSAGDFILLDLAVLHESSDERAISYVKHRAAKIVLNTQVLTGAVLVKLYSITGERHLWEVLEKQYNFLVRHTIKGCTWSYAFPPESYHAVDNYHTGGILDAILEFYEETGDGRFCDLYWKGLDYYREKLFTSVGAPRWMDNRDFPYDIHGAAQGIVSFAKAAVHRPEYLADAVRICDWTLENMYDPESGQFIYRIGRFTRWNYTLMRWCNAWMARGITELLVSQQLTQKNNEDEGDDRKSIGLRK